MPTEASKEALSTALNAAEVIRQIETLQARERLSRQYGPAANELHRNNLLAYLRAVNAGLDAG